MAGVTMPPVGGQERVTANLMPVYLSGEQSEGSGTHVMPCVPDARLLLHVATRAACHARRAFASAARDGPRGQQRAAHYVRRMHGCGSHDAKMSVAAA
jgi:hypothetical protein